jgi:hypothetical protein
MNNLPAKTGASTSFAGKRITMLTLNKSSINLLVFSQCMHTYLFSTKETREKSKARAFPIMTSTKDWCHDVFSFDPKDLSSSSSMLA